MTPKNHSLAGIRAFFGDQTVIVVGCHLNRNGTIPLGFAFAVTHELLERINSKQEKVSEIGANFAQFTEQLSYLWLQNPLRKDLTQAQIEDAILTFWAPELVITGADTYFHFKENGDDDSGGVYTHNLCLPELECALASPQNLPTGRFAQDQETGIFVCMDDEGTAKIHLAELQKGFYVDEL